MSKPDLRSAARPLPSPAVALLAATISVGSLFGCASPGPAHPPSLHLPRVVTDLTATRAGDNVTLHWTTSAKTTDGLKVPLTLTAEICRQLSSTHCMPVKRIVVHPGPSDASDTLPRNLTTGPASLLTYRIQLLNGNGHSAGLSSPAFAAAGEAPPPVQNLRVTPLREGAMLEWQPQPTESVVELDRILIQTTVPRKTAAKKSLQFTPSAPVEVYLRPTQQSSDSGGTIDPTAQSGETYRYTAQRVRGVTLSGHELELHSAPSTAITIMMRDVFPPRTPTGLAAVPSGNSIDLSWEPNTEPDLAGYIIYRRQVSPTGTTAGASTRLTPTPIPAPAYSDRAAQPGQTYAYRIAAIDTTGNESSASPEVRESLK